MARPEGTDGSDFSYREQVADRYKRMAIGMSAATFLYTLQGVAILLKVAWVLVPCFLEDTPAPYVIYGYLGLELLGTFMFWAGRPQARTILMNMKIAASCNVMLLALHFVSVYKYHVMDPKFTMYPRRIFKHYRDLGLVETDTLLQILTTLEVTIEIFGFMTLGFSLYVINAWVKDGMAIEVEVKQRNEAAAAARTALPAGPRKKKA